MKSIINKLKINKIKLNNLKIRKLKISAIKKNNSFKKNIFFVVTLISVALGASGCKTILGGCTSTNNVNVVNAVTVRAQAACANEVCAVSAGGRTTAAYQSCVKNLCWPAMRNITSNLSSMCGALKDKKSCTTQTVVAANSMLSSVCTWH